MTEFEEGSNVTTQHFDQGRAEAFAERMLDVLNGGAMALMTSIGHRTGLFDAMAGLPPSTSEQIADAANLDERYVREWLGTMWGEEKAKEMLEEAGFKEVEVKQLPHDIFNNYYIVTKG